MLRSISDHSLSYLSPEVLNCSRPSGQTLAGCKPLAHINSPMPGYHYNGSFPGLFGVHKTEREPSVGLNAEDCSAALSVVSGVASACSSVGNFLCPFTAGIGCVASTVCGGVKVASNVGSSVCGVCTEAGGTGDLASLVRQQGQAQLFADKAILDGQAEILQAVQEVKKEVQKISEGVARIEQTLKDLRNDVIYAKFITAWMDVHSNFKRITFTKDGMVVRNQRSKEFREAALTGLGIGGFSLQSIRTNIFRMLLGDPLQQSDGLFKVNPDNCQFLKNFKQMLHDSLQMEMVARKMNMEVDELPVEEFKKNIVAVEEAWVTECGCETLGGDWGEATHQIEKVIRCKVLCSTQAPRTRVDTCAECGLQGWASCGGDCIREGGRCVRRNGKSRCHAMTEGIEYQGHRIGDFILGVKSPEACSEKCVRKPNCLSWSWWVGANICSLKGQVTGERKTASATSATCEEAASLQVPRTALGEEGCWGANSCCTDIEPCDIGHGDCDYDSECKGALVCGNNNCIGKDFWYDDCCEPAKNSTFSVTTPSSPTVLEETSSPGTIQATEVPKNVIEGLRNETIELVENFYANNRKDDIWLYDGKKFCSKLLSWGEWSSCNGRNNVKISTRTRLCSQKDKACASQMRDCSCEHQPWTEWSHYSRSCGLGRQLRTKQKKECNTEVKESYCFLQECPPELAGSNNDYYSEMFSNTRKALLNRRKFWNETLVRKSTSMPERVARVEMYDGWNNKIQRYFINF